MLPDQSGTANENHLAGRKALDASTASFVSPVEAFPPGWITLVDPPPDHKPTCCSMLVVVDGTPRTIYGAAMNQSGGDR